MRRLLSRLVRPKDAERVRVLTPEPPELPRCDATLTWQVRSFWHGRARPGNADGADRCGYHAKAQIGDRRYCQRHAAAIVLHIVTERGYL